MKTCGIIWIESNVHIDYSKAFIFERLEMLSK
jgi:hypothetical protein